MASSTWCMRVLCLVALSEWQSAQLNQAQAYLVPTPAPPRPTAASLCIITVAGTVGEYNISGDGGDGTSALLLLPDRVSASRAGDVFWVVRGARCHHCCCGQRARHFAATSPRRRRRARRKIR